MDINSEYLIMTIMYCEDNSEAPFYYEAIIKLSYIFSVLYRKDFKHFITKEKEEEYDQQFKA